MGGGRTGVGACGTGRARRTRLGRGARDHWQTDSESPVSYSGPRIGAATGHGTTVRQGNGGPLGISAAPFYHLAIPAAHATGTQ